MDIPAEIRALLDGLQRRIAWLEGRVGELERENSGLRAETAALRTENGELKRRLGQDSSTSSKPPSSDGLKKKPVSLREPSEKSGGGQRGHKGDTLRRVADPDRIVTHEVSACRHCGAGLTCQSASNFDPQSASKIDPDFWDGCSRDHQRVKTPRSFHTASVIWPVHRAAGL
jgi:Family of unknown function (DUF6444)